MDYKKLLFSPEVSWVEMTEKFPVPEKLYKYQSFVREDGTENPYWLGNMNGEFHLSLGCEFEDVNDCKPNFNKSSIVKHINDFFKSLTVERRRRRVINSEIERLLSKKKFLQVETSYQNEIRIGCFTDKSDNDDMWQKYASMKRGYCIEYETKNNILFEQSTLPVFYSDEPYDSSVTYANCLILEAIKKGKHRTDEENLKIFESAYRKILKTAYIPVFVKQKQTWEFEREYRMFLWKNRSIREELLKMNQYLDEKFNIDLSNSISAIYLGESFYENENATELLNKIKSVGQKKQIPVFQKVCNGGEVVNRRII